MANKMLIDASHPEETRVVVSRGTRIEEFDFESASRKQLRGNIYLAKVTRVEPSLQAAFVDYGGNRHGFLAFSEIHPDYYQIPVADRQALLEEEQLAQAEAFDDDFESGDETITEEALSELEVKDIDTQTSEDDESPENLAAGDAYDIANEADDNDGRKRANTAALKQTFIDDTRVQEDIESGAKEVETQDSLSENLEVVEGAAKPEDDETEAKKSDADEALLDKAEHEAQNDEDNPSNSKEADSDNDVLESRETETDEELSEDSNSDEDLDVESVGSEDALEEVPLRKRSRRKTYKIQEVIRRRQIILVQVVKEERGTKGAALTTYLSLAGRHTVLMPNTPRGGGISRKITNPADRKRLRKIASELEIPSATGLIIRTAGASRTKAEIKRDYEYLLRLWENVRDLTLQSQAPCLVYEEGNLIKRSIRDHYSREIDEVLVAGDEAYREAKSFMRMIMPSHAKNVQPYKEPEPLFVKHQIERQLNELYSPFVTLESGGYIVINQTEALVAVDVNSGRATHEHNIEDTALRTNLEAAGEIARQLRLRDLAGLVVIDFIDMDERRNNRSVERRLKECLRNDRARIQVGRISHFGLLEMSRQRLRTGVLEGTTTQCPHCQGTGIIRSTDSVALSVLRSLEDALIMDQCIDLTAKTSVEVALYILNQKRLYVKDMEARYGVTITVIADQTLQGGNFFIEHDNMNAKGEQNSNVVVQMDWGYKAPEEDARKSSDDGSKRRRRRRRRRSDRPEYNSADGDSAHTSERANGTDQTESAEAGSQDSNGEDNTKERQDGRRRRRRGQRGGRRHRSQNNTSNHEYQNEASAEGGGEQNVTASSDDASGVPNKQTSAQNNSNQDNSNQDYVAEENNTQVQSKNLSEPSETETKDEASEEQGNRRPRRRGRSSNNRRRSDRNQRVSSGTSEIKAETEGKSSEISSPDMATAANHSNASEQASDAPKNKPKTETREESDKDTKSEKSTSHDRRRKSSRREKTNGKAEVSVMVLDRGDESSSSQTSDKPAKPSRKGWWQKRIGG